MKRLMMILSFASVLVFSLVFSLVSSQLALAEESHSHHSAGAGEPMKLELDHGKKWDTDKPLRDGMKRIQGLMEADIRSIHESKLTDAAYSVLSQKVTLELNQIFKNCKLKPEADAALHVILAQIIAGTTQMKSEKQGSGKRAGAVKVIGALDQYAKFFDHPGWKPVQE
ncbi:hypothetical protein BH10BDE1_BH10BDE1_23280 [soil metagenome]